ncbi:hypothetical protein CASFOL_015241 [Castilleja foliolosa]|uniref:Transmembrane protein 131-like N-terminal domain-containing protein n=1 Tax=Castilleja foliolosa TaxID=1961234 RepID=A0ABD3DD46_9LAMI
MFSLNLTIKPHRHLLCSISCILWLFLILCAFTHLVTSKGCPVYGDRSETFSPGQLTVVKRCNLSSPSLEHHNFRLTDGRVVLCSSSVSTLLDHEAHIPTAGHYNNTETYESGFLGVFPKPRVEIKPLLLDWGQKNAYYPSLEFLMVKNIDTDSVLTIFDPYSSNSQFYPCNFTGISLGPGENASICFVYLPTELGRSSGRLVLQTSCGGFLIRATGFGLKSPYSIKPLRTGLDAIKTLSLFNPFNETLSVKEVSYWISVSGNNSQSSKTICTIQSLLDLENAENCLPEIEIRPRIWEIGPRNMEPIMELDVSDYFEGKIVGAFCLQLTKLSEKKIETVIVPLEAGLNQNWGSDDKGLILVSEALVPFKKVDTREAEELVSLVLLDGSKSNPLHSLKFDLNFPFFCSRLMMKEVYAKNTGDFPLEVKRVSVSGSGCGLDGFIIRNNCEGFLLPPGECVLLEISYQSDFSSDTIKRDLELALARGVLVIIPMEASLPIYCKKLIYWTLMKKAMVVLSFLLVFLMYPRVTSNPPKTPDGSGSRNITVGINKEKKRRRRKKKSSCMGLLEVSSSQSENSTPSSPLSPVEVIKLNEQRDKNVSSKEKPNVRKFAGRPILLPSATFPSSSRATTETTTSAPCSPFLASLSPIAPHARAPGTRLRHRVNGGEHGEKMGAEDNLLTYDIWGDHLFGVSSSKQGEKVSVVNNSESFFVRDPQTLMASSSVSPCLKGK